MGAQGTTSIDFGAFPGKSDASVAVTGQAAIVAGSLVEAWIRPVATADHSIDEHLVDAPVVTAATIVAATGFTIYAVARDGIPVPSGLNRFKSKSAGPPAAPRPYGLWTVAWVWNVLLIGFVLGQLI